MSTSNNHSLVRRLNQIETRKKITQELKDSFEIAKLSHPEFFFFFFDLTIETSNSNHPFHNHSNNNLKLTAVVITVVVLKF